MTNFKPKIIIMGNKNLAVESLEYLIQTKENIVGVICNHDDHPWVKSWYKSLKAFCLKNNIKYWQPKTCNEPKFIKDIKKENPEIIFSFSYNKIIKEDFIKIPRLGIFNFHFAELPKNRGCLPVVYALASNDESIGVTFHQIDKGIDTGPIIDQRLIKITSRDTAHSLYFKCVKVAKKMFVKNFELIIKGQIKKIPQKLNEGSYHKQVYPQNRWINWHARAGEIDRFIRALTFTGYPAARTIINNQEIEILPPVKIGKNKKNGKIPGQILAINNSIIVATGTDSLILNKFRIKNSEFKAQAIIQELKLSEGNIFISNYPKILHIGNIANISYLNSKYLRAKGIESDVLCYDYYHIMGAPEWEDAIIEGDYGDDFFPDWSRVNLHGFKRPSWFMQGPLQKIGNKKFGLNKFLFWLDWTFNRGFNIGFFGLNVIIYPWVGLKKLELFLIGLNTGFFKRFPKGKKRYLMIRKKLNRKINLFFERITSKARFSIDKHEEKYFESLVVEFKKIFPQRKDQLTLNDICFFLFQIKIFKKIFKKYDLIFGYTTDAIYPLLTNFHPYVAYEIGTLREIPFENSPRGRLTALAYRKADLVFISNSDNLTSARKLGLTNYVPIPHAVEDKWHPGKIANNCPHSEKIIFSPARHDWKIKGTDLFIKAIPEIIKKSHWPLKFVFCDWGVEVFRSKQLLRKLAVEDRVQWLRPLPRYQLAKWVQKADVIIDQLILPSMGALAPEAMLAGKPLIISYRHEICQWMFPQKPPLVSAYSKTEVIHQVIRLLNNPKLAQKIGKEGRFWFYKYHSKKIVTQILIDNLKKVMKKYGQF